MTISADDHVTVSDHLARYCHAIDEGRTNDWLALWTEDGVFAVSGAPPATGREGLSGVVERVQAGSPGKTRHFVTNLFCDYGADRDCVIASYYNLVINWTQGAKIVALVVSRAVVVRQAGRWLISRVDLTPMMG